LIKKGSSDQEAARELSVSTATVAWYRARMLEGKGKDNPG
jgi:hypothetical protein